MLSYLPFFPPQGSTPIGRVEVRSGASGALLYTLGAGTAGANTFTLGESIGGAGDLDVEVYLPRDSAGEIVATATKGEQTCSASIRLG